MNKNKNGALNSGFKPVKTLLFILFIVAIIMSWNTLGQPTGANITFNVTEEPLPAPAASITTAGGSFTKLVLNGSFQTQRWKAYVGNVSGIITLDDANKQTIYDWNLASISGEVYVSRNDTISWTNISCAAQSTINSEETYLNINGSGADSINNTFNETVHKEFWVGTNQIVNSTCNSIITYVNDTKQTAAENAPFQEILLRNSLDEPIYASILENKAAGYDLSNYDFQLIVPEDETQETPTTYYFYVEIS